MPKVDNKLAKPTIPQESSIKHYAHKRHTQLDNKLDFYWLHGLVGFQVQLVYFEIEVNRSQYEGPKSMEPFCGGFSRRKYFIHSVAGLESPDQKQNIYKANVIKAGFGQRMRFINKFYLSSKMWGKNE